MTRDSEIISHGPTTRIDYVIPFRVSDGFRGYVEKILRSELRNRLSVIEPDISDNVHFPEVGKIRVTLFKVTNKDSTIIMNVRTSG